MWDYIKLHYKQLLLAFLAGAAIAATFTKTTLDDTLVKEAQDYVVTLPDALPAGTQISVTNTSSTTPSATVLNSPTAAVSITTVSPSSVQ